MAETARKEQWTPDAPHSRLSTRDFTYRVLIAVAAASGAFLLWRITDVLMLAFGGLVLALLLRGASAPVARRTGLPERWALALTTAVIFGLLGLAGWALGGQIAAQSRDLAQSLPDALSKASQSLQQTPVGGLIPDLGAAEGKLLPNLARFVTTAFGAIGNTVLIIFLGIYFAAAPDLYRRGLVRLLPPAGRPKAEAALTAAGCALRQWLVGKLISMLLVGALTTGGLTLLGMPLALSLGVLAGLLEFVPFVGPIVAAVPGILLAFGESPQTALYVALAYLAIQQVESYVIEPLVQRWAVALPPALGILAVVAFGLLFGVLGLLFAVPLMVLVMVLVQRLYVRTALES